MNIFQELSWKIEKRHGQRRWKDGLGFLLYEREKVKSSSWWDDSQRFSKACVDSVQESLGLKLVRNGDEQKSKRWCQD